MQQPKYQARDEQALMSTLWSRSLADDPEAFVLYVFPWQQANTPLANFTGPRKWQRDVLRELTAHIKSNKGQASPEVLQKAIASGRGIGKSALVAWLILWMLTTRLGSTVIVSANSETQLRTVTWGELTKWHAMAINSHWFEISATKLAPAQWLTEIVERDLKKGTRYWAAEGKLWSEENPDGYAGAHSHDGMMLIFDEASGIADSIWPVAQGFFTEPIEPRFWFAFSNPRKNEGYFFECFNAKRDFWNTTQIDSRTVEGTDKRRYEQIIAEYGADSREARVEVYGEFPQAGDDQFIPPRLVDDAFDRPRWKDTTAPIVIGVDPARGGDTTVIAIRQGRDLIRINRHKDTDTMDIVGRVIDAIEEFKPVLVVIDEGGLGYGVVDRLKEQRYKCVRGVNFGQKSRKPVMYGNLRAQMWSDMKEWLKNAALPRDKLLKTDLTGVKLKPDSSGTMYLEGKKEMKARGLASPDAADAIAVTFAYPLARREPVEKRETRVVHGSPTVASSWMGA